MGRAQTLESAFATYWYRILGKVLHIFEFQFLYLPNEDNIIYFIKMLLGMT